MHKMRNARTKDEVWELKNMIEEAHNQRGREIRKVESVRWDGVVRWGGESGEGEGEDGISCEFDEVSFGGCEGEGGVEEFFAF